MIFLLPAIAVGLAGAANTISAAGRIKAVQKKYRRRRRRYDKAIKRCRKQASTAKRAVETLGSERVKSVKALGEAAWFLGNAKVKERDLSERCHVCVRDLEKWKGTSVRLGEIIAGTGTSVLAGVGTSMAAYGAVSSLAAAGTGAAISGLSGAAATTASLAYIGGGTLAAGGGGVAAGTLALGGLIAGPAILVGSFFAQKKADKIKNKVNKSIAEMDRDKAEKREAVSCLTAAARRSEEVFLTTRTLRRALAREIPKADPENDEDAYRIACMAKALGDLIEIRIFEGGDNRP